MKKGIFVGMGYTTAFMLIFMGVLLIFPTFLVELFTKEAIVVETGVRAIKFFSMALPLMGIQICLFTFLIATGNVVRAFILNAGKTIILFVPLTVILTNIIGLDGLIFSYPIADMVYVLVTLFTVFPLIIKLKGTNVHKEIKSEERLV